MTDPTLPLTGKRGTDHAGSEDRSVDTNSHQLKDRQKDHDRDGVQLEQRVRIGKILFIVTSIGLLLFSLYVVHLPIHRLLEIVPDDAFYYLKVAQNIAATGVSTFDGISPTNGYHPAWMALMALCARFSATREGLLQACLLTGFAFHFATGLLLVPIFRRLVGREWAWLGAALWMLNAWPLLLALQGVEASFYIFTLSMLVYTYLRLIAPSLHAEQRPATSPPLSAFALLGANAGLTMLGRTEGGLLMVTLGVYLLICLWRNPKPRPAPGHILLALTIYVGMAALVFLPWLLYSRWQVGTMTQDSGAMKMLWAAEEHLQPGGRLKALGDTFAGNWITIFMQLTIGMGRLPFLAQFVLFVPVLYLMLKEIGKREQGISKRSPNAFQAIGIWMLAGLFVSSAVYGMMFTDRQVWYTAQPAITEYILGFCLILFSVERFAWLRRHLNYPRLATLLSLVTLLVFARFALKLPSYYRWQPDFYESEARFEAQVPTNARIGCFNAGIPAYFGNRTVVNLDGLVNHAVLPYYRERRFDQYLIEQHIDFIADEDSGLERASQFAAAPIVVLGRGEGRNSEEHISNAAVALRPLDSVPLHNWIAPTRWLWKIEYSKK